MRKRTDANQREIVCALERMGVTVLVLSDVGHGCPDLLAGFNGKNWLLELKDGAKSQSRRKLTSDQERFHRDWRGQIAIIKSIDEAIDFVNLRRQL